MYAPVRSPGATSRRVVVALLVVLAASLSGVSPARAALAPCPASADTFVWDGAAGPRAGDGASWNDARNWDVGCVPGQRLENGVAGPYDDEVTIPAGADVTLGGSSSAQLAALHNAGRLTVATGAKLGTYGDSESAQLVLRGLLFGTGRFTVTGSLAWVSLASGPAAQSTRWCPVESPCTAPPAAPGTTVVAPGAAMTVSGKGVNLQDSRVVENLGTVTLSGEGYVAANYGTAFRNLRSGSATGRFVFRNDGDYAQGIDTGQPLGTFVNTGVVVKAAGTGTSFIDATYRDTDGAPTPVGRVEVRSGTLNITTAGELSTASVTQGATFGTLGEKGQDADRPQASSLQLAQSGTGVVPVSLRELAEPNAGHGAPVQVETPGAAATRTTPLRLRIVLDTSLLAGDDPDLLAKNAPVYRKGHDDTVYKTLPNCGTTLPTAAQACVSRSRSVNETSAAGGDLVMVVETLTNTRYKVG